VVRRESVCAAEGRGNLIRRGRKVAEVIHTVFDHLLLKLHGKREMGMSSTLTSRGNAKNEATPKERLCTHLDAHRSHSRVEMAVQISLVRFSSVRSWRSAPSLRRDSFDDQFADPLDLFGQDRKDSSSEAKVGASRGRSVVGDGVVGDNGPKDVLEGFLREFVQLRRDEETTFPAGSEVVGEKRREVDVELREKRSGKIVDQLGWISYPCEEGSLQRE